MSIIDPKLQGNLLLIARNSVNIVAIYRDKTHAIYYLYFMGKPYSVSNKTDTIKRYNDMVPIEHRITVYQ